MSASDNLCIIDDEVDSIIVEGDCSNGIKLSCPGTNGNYSCELADNNTRYKVSGLKHSAVSEYIYTAPVQEPVKIQPVILMGGRKKAPVPKVEPEETPAEEPVVEETVEVPLQEEPLPQPVESGSRFAAITGRVTNSIKKSPTAWGSGLGIAIAISLIGTIYISTRKVNKKFFKN